MMEHFATRISSSDNSSHNAGSANNMDCITQLLISGQNFRCPSCPYQSSYKHCVDRHFLTHTGEKPFQCTLCSYRCSIKENLKRHLLIHYGEKPFSCHLCSYKCSRKDSLNKHILIHSTEKSFNCPSSLPF